MAEAIDKFMTLDIPEERYLSRNIQTVWARAVTAGASPEETAMAVLAIVAGNVTELEERLLALERKA